MFRSDVLQSDLYQYVKVPKLLLHKQRIRWNCSRVSLNLPWNLACTHDVLSLHRIKAANIGRATHIRIKSWMNRSSLSIYVGATLSLVDVEAVLLVVLLTVVAYYMALAGLDQDVLDDVVLAVQDYISQFAEVLDHVLRVKVAIDDGHVPNSLEI